MNRVASLTIAGFVLAVSTGQASAQSRGFDVVGSAPQVCNIESPTLGDRVSNVQAFDGSSIRIVSLVNPQSLATTAATAELNLTAVCTVPHRLTVQSRNNGLWRAQGGAVNGGAGFTSAVPYRVDVEWGDVRDRLDVDALSRGPRQRSTLIDKPVVGDLTLLVVIEPGASNLYANAPLLAGAYSDILTVTLEPQ
ncbi:hypothetical protein [Brevundimonas sp. Root1423]|uniref:hypothetical protein n=1 Tax=Brevundimonas sp. Root1423 TaxID=1736462 RepID=UPI0006FF0E6E|nr:hypothetical protein [Brevundimonas sp. Root1423]KQY75384.1 hypothetical protein ASD25_12680 [Brevundimonas sp. Root1423]